MDTDKMGHYIGLFPKNGSIINIVNPNSYLYLLYSGFTFESQLTYYKMRQTDIPFINEHGIIWYDGCHVFNKCNDYSCFVCAKYNTIKFNQIKNRINGIYISNNHVYENIISTLPPDIVKYIIQFI